MALLPLALLPAPVLVQLAYLDGATRLTGCSEQYRTRSRICSVAIASGGCGGMFYGLFATRSGFSAVHSGIANVYSTTGQSKGACVRLRDRVQYCVSVKNG